MMLTRRPRRQIKEAEREDYGAGRFGHGDLGGSTAETASRRPTTGSAGQGDPSARHRALQEQARFGAFLAERQFSRDVAFAVWLPLVLAAFAARSCDAPRAALGTCEDRRTHGLALSSFPCGAHASVQMLHVVTHLPWYLLVRPARVGDWVGLLSNVHHLTFAGLVLSLAMAPRQGGLWAWWRRHRVSAAWSTARGGSTLLHLASYPLLPRDLWPDAVYSPYTLLVSKWPVASTLLFCALDLLVGFPLLPAIAGIVLHTAVVWVAAYTIAPRILLMEQNQLPEGIGEPGSNISDSSLSHSLLRCDSPRMSRLVSCRPVWVQCLLAAFLVAFPAAMATASQRWLWSRYRKAVASKQAGEGPAGLPAFEQQEQEQQRGGQERQRREVSGRVAAGGLPTGVDPTALGDPLYEGLSRSQAVAVKVLQHPGSLEEHGPRLAAAVRQALREADRDTRRQHRHQREPRARQSPLRRRAAGSAAAPTGGGTVAGTDTDCAQTATSSAAHAPVDPPPLLGPAVRPFSIGGERDAAAAATPPGPAPAAPADSSPRLGSREHAVVCSRWAVMRGCMQLVLRSRLLPRGRRHRARPPGPDAPSGGSGSGSDGSATESYGSEDGSDIEQDPYGSPTGRDPGGVQNEDEEVAGGLAARMLSALSGLGHVSGVSVLMAGSGRRMVITAEGEQEAQGATGARAVDLLRLHPPALALPAGGSRDAGASPTLIGEAEAEESGPESGQAGQQQQEGEAGAGSQQGFDGRLTLVLQSPVGQAVRLVVLREDPAAVAAGAHASGDIVAAEFPLQLLGGVQEVEVELTGVLRAVAGPAAGAQAQEPPAKVLHVLLLPPGGVVRSTGGEEQPQPQAGAGAGEEGGRGGGAGGSSTAVHPLVHFMVPLLLLPVAAAAELARLDDRMRAHVQAWQQQQQHGTPGQQGSAAAAAAGEEAATPAYQSSAGAPPAPSTAGPGGEAFGYWGAHMAPLLDDIALVLWAGAYGAQDAGGGSSGSDRGGDGDDGDGGGGENGASTNSGGGGGGGEGAPTGGGAGAYREPEDGNLYGAGSAGDAAWALSVLLPHLLAFLRAERMDATADVLVRQTAAAPPPVEPPPQSPSAPRAQQGPGARGSSSDLDIRLRFEPEASTRPTAPAAGPVPVPGSPAAPKPAPTPPPSPFATPGPSTPASRHGAAHSPSSPAEAAPVRLSLTHLLRGFRPHTLERQFREWRAAGVARVALPLVALAAAPHVVALAASAWALGAPPNRLLEPPARWPHALSTVAWHAASWAGDAAGHLAVLVMLSPTQRRDAEQHKGALLEQAGHEQGRAAQGSVAAHPPTAPVGAQQERPNATAAARASDTGPSLDRVYTIGALVTGPLLLLLLSAIALLLQRCVQWPKYAGGHTAALALATVRTAVVPCTQQLAALHVVWAGPVLVAADALLVKLLLPGWGCARAWSLAAGWRLLALLVSMGFEWAARKRFLKELKTWAEEGGSAAGRGVPAGVEVQHGSGGGGRLGHYQMPSTIRHRSKASK